MKWILTLFVVCSFTTCVLSQELVQPLETEIQEELQAMQREAEQEVAEQEELVESLREEELIAEIDRLELIEDTSPAFNANKLEFSGNTLISSEKLLKNVPDVYNMSDQPLFEADSQFLYDFRSLKMLADEPDKPVSISTRTIQGFTHYLLNVYQRYGYAGVYVYVPADSIVEGMLRDEALRINILEAQVSNIIVRHMNVEGEEVEKGYLKESAIRDWSPVKPGEIVKKKELNDYVGLLNLNPDRYVAPVISKGDEPNSLALSYNVYEADPWHWFVQVDNAGQKKRQCSPKFGLINTNLLGYDDVFSTVYQQSLFHDNWEDNYSVYGNYDFPFLIGPRLRLQLFAGYSEYDQTSDTGGYNFLGNGSFGGGRLRFNLFQENNWFFDVLGGVTYEESRNTTVLGNIFTIVPGNTVRYSLWNAGVEFYRRNDMENTLFAFEMNSSWDASDQLSFETSRLGSDRDFEYYTFTATHSQYLDEDKIQRLSGAFEGTYTPDRLVSSKLTTFGGMYSVRGYDENEIVADQGIITSLQYEYDLIAADEAKYSTSDDRQKKKGLRKFAPLVFVDYGIARNVDTIPGEDKDQELASFGPGIAFEYGENFSGACYYGYPLIATDSTNQGKGRLNFGLLYRW